MDLASWAHFWAKRGLKRALLFGRTLESSNKPQCKHTKTQTCWGQVQVLLTDYGVFQFGNKRLVCLGLRCIYWKVGLFQCLFKRSLLRSQGRVLLVYLPGKSFVPVMSHASPPGGGGSLQCSNRSWTMFGETAIEYGCWSVVFTPSLLRCLLLSSFQASGFQQACTSPQLGLNRSFSGITSRLARGPDRLNCSYWWAPRWKLMRWTAEKRVLSGARVEKGS